MEQEDITKQFVEQFYIEKVNMLVKYFTPNNKTEVSALINKLKLDNDQLICLKDIVSTLLTDTMYTILLGLDGAATLGSIQQEYAILDENNNNLSKGDIEVYAYEYFYNGMYEKENK